MRIFYFILFVSGFCAGFAQNKKLEGIWVEYKREVIGDTNTSAYAFNGNFQIGDIHQFFSNHETFFYSNTVKSDFKHESFYEFYNDTLFLMPYVPGDYASPVKPYLATWPKPNEMILSDACGTSYYSVRRYFKRTNRLPKHKAAKRQSIDEPATFPGGDDSLVNFVSKNLDTTLHFEPINGKVGIWLDLIIDAEGKVTDVQIPECSEKRYVKEAIRIARLMSKWIPAKDYPIRATEINPPFKNVKSEVSVYFSFIKKS